MSEQLNLDLSQDIPNQLTAYADQERAKLVPRNDYNGIGNPYSSTNQDAMANGDSKGRGTGVYLDVYNDNAGTVEDLADRKNQIKINKYNSKNGYPNFQL